MAKLQQGMVVDLAPTEAIIQPGQSHQECARLQTGENIRYAFDASAPLGVSLSYDNEGKPVSVVSESEQQTSLMQRFTAEAPHTYCVNWRNTGKRPVTVKYRYTPEYHMQTLAPSKPTAF
jgi:hypothetical protein